MTVTSLHVAAQFRASFPPLPTLSPNSTFWASPSEAVPLKRNEVRRDGRDKAK